ncbi:2387_t:CDS:10 [Diversispora eburnea]|uniref:2387_t:CDS:1 n=1 Tax=Diversispora eburnea TaxID=1213867 RepID=A0A9N8ZFX5_9GLOM|nr:2387_t:CDS:10 [Diversispora eburnea]
MPTSEALNSNAHENQATRAEHIDVPNNQTLKGFMKVNSQKTTSLATPINAKKNSASKKRPLDLQELNMIQNKISQLETESSIEDEEEKAIAKAIKKASREMKDIINSNDNQMEKIETIQQKYMELFQEMKRLERDHVKMKKRNEQLQKEKDSAKSELSKTNSMKHKLENICRELQKENKRIKEEGRRLAATEQQKREELSGKFENTIWEIKSKMEEDTGEKKKRAEDNELLKDKFRGFLEQYELREKHFNSVVRSKDLELQLYEAKLQQQKQLTEKEIIKVNSLKGQVDTLAKNEIELRKQLNVYVDKFKQVEETLNKSNELFMTFRKEMEQMTKKTKKLEKENSSIKGKCDTMNKNILEMAEERARNQKSVEDANKRQAKLENLCRALQAERAVLKKKVESLESTPSLVQRPSTPISCTGEETEEGLSDLGSPDDLGLFMENSHSTVSKVQCLCEIETDCYKECEQKSNGSSEQKSDDSNEQKSNGSSEQKSDGSNETD